MEDIAKAMGCAPGDLFLLPAPGEIANYEPPVPEPPPGSTYPPWQNQHGKGLSGALSLDTLKGAMKKIYDKATTDPNFPSEPPYIGGLDFGTSDAFPSPQSVHFKSNKDDWETPLDFYAKLCLQLEASGGKVPQLDVCATEDSKRAELCITPEMDALNTDWDIFGPGTVCWMNPPYSKASKFCERAMLQAQQRGVIVVGLVAARTETKWWWDYVLAAKRIIFLKGRLTFQGAKANAPFPSAVVVWSPQKFHDQVPPVWWEYKTGKMIQYSPVLPPNMPKVPW